MLTQELLRELFEYKDGFLYWKINVAKNVKAGDLAGGIWDNKGEKRWRIMYKKRGWAASRLIFIYHHGYLPEIVDHIDRNSLNDNIENLRAATKFDNMRNRSSVRGSSSKYLGVTFIKGVIKENSQKWRAIIRIDGKNMYLGNFVNEIDAAKAYNEVATKLFGEFANLNKISA